ncbi:hypothetical protein FHS85_002923 [Rhodoligotrophos appendicifer]
MSLAWHTVALNRAKRLPKLKTLLVVEPAPVKRRRSVDEQIAIALAWTKALQRKG